MNDKKKHWENVYETKRDQEVSWYQDVPQTSLRVIASLKKELNIPIIDVGGGNSNLIGELQKQGYSDLTLLDISGKAIERNKSKIGLSGDKIKWIVSDILEFNSEQQYEIWHDRATFHFLIDKEAILRYVELVGEQIKKGGFLILATFSTSGPLKCSGLDITQYDKEKLVELFSEQFDLKESFDETHQTPFKTEQNFIYSIFQKR